MFSSCQGAQAKLHMVYEPDGLTGGFSFLSGSDRSSEVSEVMSEFESNSDITLLYLRNHFDEESDLVWLPKGHHTKQKSRLLLMKGQITVTNLIRWLELEVMA